MPDTVIPQGVVIVGAIAIAIAILVMALIAIKGRQVAPPAAPAPAGNTPGEALASPFAEQIEDVVRAKLDADPALKKYQIDFGTAPDGSLEIDVDGKKYAGIDAIPDERLREVIRGAVKAWEKGG